LDHLLSIIFLRIVAKELEVGGERLKAKVHWRNFQGIASGRSIFYFFTSNLYLFIK